MSSKKVVLFWDGFILLMYKSLGKKEIVNKHHQSCLCPFNRTFILNKALSWCMSWSISFAHGLTRPVRSANQDLQNETFLSAVGFQPGTFRLRSELSNHCARSDIYRALKMKRTKMKFMRSTMTFSEIIPCFK